MPVAFHLYRFLPRYLREATLLLLLSNQVPQSLLLQLQPRLQCIESFQFQRRGLHFLDHRWQSGVQLANLKPHIMQGIIHQLRMILNPPKDLVLLVVEGQHGDRLDVRHVFEGAQNKVLHTDCTKERHLAIGFVQLLHGDALVVEDASETLGVPLLVLFLLSRTRPRSQQILPSRLIGVLPCLVYGQNAQNIGPTDVVTAGEAGIFEDLVEAQHELLIFSERLNATIHLCISFLHDNLTEKHAANDARNAEESDQKKGQD
mmetsp:Transcript_69854/g.110448  ORF Transcript_69854/g.110448 Transcript_69854/m.110448 type:complete len:260 (-) Transcript_69854:552-1331(-)